MKTGWWIGFGLAATVLQAHSAQRAFALDDATERSTGLSAEIQSLDLGAAQADPPAAIEHARELLARAQQSGELDNSSRARLHLYLGTGYFGNNQGEEALEAFEIARDALIAEGLADSDQMAEVQSYIGSAYAELGRLDEARAVKSALLDRQRSRNGADSAEYADILYGLGFLDYRTGDFEGALEKISQAAAIMRATTPGEQADPNAAIYGMSEAAVLARLGRVEEGLAAARQASIWADANLGSESLVTAAAANNYGGLLNAAGRYREAEAVLRRSLGIKRKLIGDEHPETAIAINALAFAMEKLGEAESAEALYLESARIFETNPDKSAPSQGTRVLLNAATLAFERGDFAAALERRKRALATITKALGNDNPDTADARLHLGESLYQAGRFDDAARQLGKANTLFAESVDAHQKYRVRAEMMYGLALQKTRRGKKGFEIASSAYRAIAERIEQVAAQDREIVKAENDYRETLGLYAALAVERGELASAFSALQLARYGELDRSVRALAGRQSAGGAAAADALRVIQDLRSESAVLEAELSTAIAAGDTRSIDRAEARVREKRTDLTIKQIQFSRDFPGLAHYAQGTLISLEEARASLAPEDALLIVQPTSFGIVSLAITDKGVAAANSAMGSYEGRQFVHEIRESIDLAMLIPNGNPTFPVDAAHSLYEGIFPRPITNVIAKKSSLKVLASSYLASLPFTLLVTDPAGVASLKDTAWLIRKFAVSTPLSLRELKKDGPEESFSLRFAGIGAPNLAPTPEKPVTLAGFLRGARGLNITDIRKLPSLPAAKNELEQLSRAFAGQDNLVVTGKNATEGFVKSTRLADYSVVAFATHGLTGSELSDLAEPALVLSPGGEDDAPDDGLLTASEIEKLHLEAEWVILSACNTAAGSDSGASPFSGLASAFVYAGARTLLVSHWPVRDDAAAALSVQTVKASATGMSRAQALRQAQLSLIDRENLTDASHPAVWAPFVLVGD